MKEVFPHDENRVQYSLATSKSGENVITEENLEDLLALSKHITENIKVEKDGKTYGWEEVCIPVSCVCVRK